MTTWNADHPHSHTVGAMGVLVRGWLHGNIVRIGPDLVDTGYHTGFESLDDWLVGPVDRVFLTHVHSDHAGGVAALRDRDRIEVFAHPDAMAIVSPWDEGRLWLTGTGQALPRFAVDARLPTQVDIGGHPFDVIHTPGHATGGVCFVDDDGVMISGDALWERGFGILNPTIDGPGVFADAALALDRIAEVAPRLVIPGHGPPFTDVTGSLKRARHQLEQMKDPEALRKRGFMGAIGFWALINPTLDAAAIRAKLADYGVAPDAPWIEPLLRKLGR